MREIDKKISCIPIFLLFEVEEKSFSRLVMFGLFQVWLRRHFCVFSPDPPKGGEEISAVSDNFPNPQKSKKIGGFRGGFTANAC